VIVDTSAIVAILNREPGWEAYDLALRQSPHTLMSAASYVELGIVVDRTGNPSISHRLDRLLDAWGIKIADLTADQARTARSAHSAYGQGTGHPAHLNLGDCFSYALAADTGETLLFTGEDFAHTDVESAI
jgi:ribonuclease VapC